jgi:hypothetical protein
MTAKEALDKLKVSELMAMSKIDNKYNRETAKAVMILVYHEKENHSFAHF